MGERRTITKWRRVADQIDRYFRLIVPVLYFIVIGIMLSTDLSDDYHGESQYYEKTGGSVPPGTIFPPKSPPTPSPPPPSPPPPPLPRNQVKYTRMSDDMFAQSFGLSGFPWLSVAAALFFILVVVRMWMHQRAKLSQLQKSAREGIK